MNTELSTVNENEISIPTPKQKRVIKRKVDAAIVEEEKVSEIILVAQPVSSSNATEATSAVIVDDVSVLREMMREKDELEVRIKMFEEQKKIKRNIGEYRETLIIKKKELKNAKLIEMECLREELMTIDMEIETIKTLSEDDLITVISRNSKLMEDCGLIQDINNKRNPTIEREKKGTRTAIDRKAYPNYLVDKMVFQSSGNHKTDKLRGKITMEVVFNADTKKFYNRTTKTEYDLLQDANRVWCNERGYDKLGNAWEDFKALNLKTKKTRSIQNLHNDNWVEDEGAEDYVDITFSY